ncbi:Beta-lactamase PSE-4 precursor [Photobacterium malacitanum]|uniref:beta-lactamase n=1 Tax=Photobacterium malacitanum TaxID=2204294 RepID=A0A1Y6MQ87_9GAMM|nr:class A beta-lactamase [Photobacterium malacitanum]SMY37958.1 Beta-lactamase PSE-4 precursor [Photobacterium malacitanum]
MKLPIITSALLLSFSQLASAQISQISPELAKIEHQLGGTVAVAVYNANTNTSWSYHGEQRVPMMSTFKTLACADLLHQADTQRIDVNQAITIKQSDILSYAPVTTDRVGTSMTLAQLCNATMLTSDNTAANLVLNNIGGPKSVTQFIRTLDDKITRLDRIEPNVNNVSAAELRDTTTPIAINSTLYHLLYTDALSTSARKQLKQWMMDNKVSDPLLRAVLPAGWHIADRSGYDSTYGSRGITAAVWQQGKQPIMISIYLAQTGKPMAELNTTIANIGQLIFQHLK